MVSERERYAPGAEGAPPVPPAGGYRGRRRAFNPATQQPAQPSYRTTGDFVTEHQRAVAAQLTPGQLIAQGAKPVPAASVTEITSNAQRAFGTVALAGSVIFALALAFMLFSTRPDTYWAVPILVLQGLVVALGLYATTKPPARFRGLLALALAGLVNVATMSMLATVLAAAG